jgi:dienelactone hydrolase
MASTIPLPGRRALTLASLLCALVAPIEAAVFAASTGWLAAVAFACRAAAAEPSRPLDVEIRRLPDEIARATTSLNPRFIVASPAAPPATGAKPLPLLIHLHGAGDRGTDIEKLRDRQPVRFLGGRATQAFVIVMPQCLADDGGTRRIWEVADLELLFAHLEHTVSFDADRVSLTGYSMGGYGTWAWAAAFPQRFAAISPHAGGLGAGGPKDVTGDLDAWATRLAPLPIRIVHGADDTVVPAERSKRMFAALKAHGARQAELILLPGKAHAIGDSFADERLYAWLLTHARGAGSASRP